MAQQEILMEAQGMIISKWNAIWMAAEVASWDPYLAPVSLSRTDLRDQGYISHNLKHTCQDHGAD